MVAEFDKEDFEKNKFKFYNNITFNDRALHSIRKKYWKGNIINFSIIGHPRLNVTPLIKE